jgi:outer membrane immunogenic protein
MKTFLISAALAASFATAPALAADMPVKAPIAPMPTAYNWTGFYTATSVGGMWTDQHTDWPFRTPGTLSEFFDHKRSTGIWGSHAGIQWQFSNVVFGAELGYSLPFRDGISSLTLGAPNTGCPNPAFSCGAGISKIFTAGPRLGWGGFDGWLIYATGGYASARIESRSVLATAPFTQFDDIRVTRSGWFAGGGIDYVAWKGSLFGDVVLGVEYQHLDFGNVRLFSPGDPIGVVTNARDISSRADVVRARLTFMHSWGSLAPIAASY